MTNKKNGFTLIEITVVLLLLSIIFLFAVPAFNSSTKKLKNENKNLIAENVESAAKTYLELNISKLNKDYFSCGNYYISINELITNGLLSKPIVDPVTKEEIDYDSQVEISYDSSSNLYTYAYPAVGNNTNDNNINSIVSGANHTLLLNNNILYGVGDNTSNQLSLTNSSYNQFTYIKDNVTYINTKGNSSFYINNNKELYGFGNNNYGQLGIGNATSTTEINEIVVDSAKKVTTSGETTFILSDNNQIYVTGRNDYGQLGTENNDNVLYPIVNTKMYNPNSLVTSLNSTYFSTSDAAYFSGNNITNSFTKIDIESIKQIYGNNENTFLLLKSGEVYAKGNNLNGSLGLNSTDSISEFTKIDGLENIKNIITTENTTFFITSNNEVYTSGRNDYGQLGLGDYTDKLIPTKINIDNVINIYAHKEFTFFVKTNKELYATGNNTLGQLGLGDTLKTNIITHVPNVSNIKLVSFTDTGSVYVVNNNNTLYASGYNTNGELGFGNNTSTVNFKPICLN